jgi:hypothetical protein
MLESTGGRIRRGSRRYASGGVAYLSTIERRLLRDSRRRERDGWEFQEKWIDRDKYPGRNAGAAGDRPAPAPNAHGSESWANLLGKRNISFARGFGAPGWAPPRSKRQASRLGAVSSFAIDPFSRPNGGSTLRLRSLATFAEPCGHP